VLEVQNDFLGPVNLFVVRDGVAPGGSGTCSQHRATLHLGSEVVGVGGMSTSSPCRWTAAAARPPGACW
jgi:hypothetical protein